MSNIAGCETSSGSVANSTYNDASSDQIALAAAEQDCGRLHQLHRRHGKIVSKIVQSNTVPAIADEGAHSATACCLPG
jgi:hypothetical protein